MRTVPKQRPVRASERLRVLVVAPGAALAASMQTALQQAGMAIELAETGAEALARLAAAPASVVVVDLDLPDMPGLHLVARLAAAGDAGVIAIAADARLAVHLRAAETGADDIVAKPVALKALVARIRALDQRRRRPSQARVPLISLDRAGQALADASGRRTRLTAEEFAALTTLLEAEGASVSREWLGRISLRRLLHDGDDTVDELIDSLRRKLAGHGAPARTILGARGQSYAIGDPSVFAEGAED